MPVTLTGAWSRAGFCSRVAWAVAFLFSLSSAEARVTNIQITLTGSAFSAATFGSVGAYRLIQGKIIGTVDPTNPQNSVITDLALAPKNPDGTVSYSADFQIFTPADPSKANHRVIFDLPNRGNALGLLVLNDSKTPSTMGSTLASAFGDPGNAFLMNQGYTLVEGAWDIVAKQGGTSYGVTFPIAKNPDGSSITGPALEEFVIDFNKQPASEPLMYPAASPDQSKASLSVRKNYGDTPIQLPPSAWAYADSTMTAIKLTAGDFGAPGTFGPTALYEFTYIAKDPVVAGLGFASLRDLATFLRHAQTDDGGTANPLAGNVRAIYTSCVSQPCRTMNDFVRLGFNEAEYDHKNPSGTGADGQQRVMVFDGMINWIAGGDGIFMNYRFAQPARTSRQHIARWFPEFEFPWANHVIHDEVTGKTDGRLARCQLTQTCPKIFELNSENEYWSKGGSLLTADTKGQDLPLEATPDVRYYLMSSLPHGAGTGNGICAQPQNPLKPSAVLRALFVDLDQWVTRGVAPPDNRLPRRSDGTLAPPLPQTDMGFPPIPGVTYNGNLHTGDLFDFGPQFDQGILSVLPPKLVGTPYPVFVPTTDADGNDIAGIRLPEVSVPVATYTGWGLRAQVSGDPAPMVDGCDHSGQMIPFARTRAERLQTGDPRPSIEERYPDHATYVNLVTNAARRLEAQRLLLDEDVRAYITAATNAHVPN